MITDHIAEAWLAVGFILLAVELIAFGMASGVLLFAGIGALITGGLLWFGLLPPLWSGAVLAFGGVTALSVLLLWGPFKRLQSERRVDHRPTSDLIGLRFRLDREVTAASPGTTRYSGVDWRVEIAADAAQQTIAAGSEVEVVTVDVGLFRVRPVNAPLH